MLAWPTAINASARLVALCIAAVYASALALYQMEIGYSDHVQASVASIGWHVVHNGAPTYPDWSSGQIYGLQYGPLLYWINGLSMLGSASIAMTKVAGVFAILLGLFLTTRAAWKTTEAAVAWPILLGLAIAQIVPLQSRAFWNRGEPYLYLITAATLTVSIIFKRKLVVGAAIVGLLAGAAAGIKIHGFLYAVPAGALLLSQAKTVREYSLILVAGSIAAVAAVAFPILLDQTTLTNYPRYLTLVVEHGFPLEVLQANASYALRLLFPPVFILIYCRPALSREDFWFGIGLAFALTVAGLIGSKAGAGPHHLLPLAPCFLYASARLLANRSQSARATATQTTAAAALLLLAVIVSTSFWGLIQQTARPVLMSHERAERHTEFLAALSAYPDAEVGVAGEATYADTFFRPLQVARNGKLHLEIASWMDLQFAGISEEVPLQLIQECAIREWLMPQGAPFTMPNWYSAKPLFSERFRKIFAEQYAIVAQGRYYSIWRCKAAS